jgi:hypothetical protein
MNFGGLIHRFRSFSLEEPVGAEGEWWGGPRNRPARLRPIESRQNLQYLMKHALQPIVSTGH